MKKQAIVLIALLMVAAFANLAVNAQQTTYSDIVLRNNTDERACFTMMRLYDGWWWTSGWYCVGAGESNYTGLRTDTRDVYFYGTSSSRIWKAYWDRNNTEVPEHPGFVGIVDLANRHAHRYPNTGQRHQEINIQAGYERCMQKVANDCRTVAMTRAQGNPLNGTLVFSISEIPNVERPQLPEGVTPR